MRVDSYPIFVDICSRYVLVSLMNRMAHRSVVVQVGGGGLSRGEYRIIGIAKLVTLSATAFRYNCTVYSTLPAEALL